MDNSLKTKEKIAKADRADAPAKSKTKALLIGKELKTKDLCHTAVDRANRPGNKPKVKDPDSLRRAASQAADAARPSGKTRKENHDPQEMER